MASLLHQVYDDLNLSGLKVSDERSEFSSLMIQMFQSFFISAVGQLFKREERSVDVFITQMNLKQLFIAVCVIKHNP
jgi:hypothetical protein